MSFDPSGPSTVRRFIPSISYHIPWISYQWWPSPQRIKHHQTIHPKSIPNQSAKVIWWKHRCPFPIGWLINRGDCLAQERQQVMMRTMVYQSPVPASFYQKDIGGKQLFLPNHASKKSPKEVFQINPPLKPFEKKIQKVSQTDPLKSWKTTTSADSTQPPFRSQEVCCWSPAPEATAAPAPALPRARCWALYCEPGWKRWECQWRPGLGWMLNQQGWGSKN